MREKEFLPSVEEKLGISELNPMQRESMRWGGQSGTLLISAPTGSGKTLAFVLPMLKLLKPASGNVQCVVLTPTRELNIQVTDIVRTLAKGYKVTSLYGGHKFQDEENTLRETPCIVVATPGRLADHINRRTIDIRTSRILILDEFDKILELGFEKEMKRVVGKLPNVSRLILTSATPVGKLPEWLGAKNVSCITAMDDNIPLRKRMRVHEVESDEKDKIGTLCDLLCDIMPSGQEKTIVFVNHRESAERVCVALKKRGIISGLYHGALDQDERENAVAIFNNGSRPILVSTDLAARGLDIEEVKNIIHYHQPLTEEAYIHRNGRTARASGSGDVYVIIGPQEDVKPWMEFDDRFFPGKYAACRVKSPAFGTLYFFAGKKEKISKGDILGFLVKQGGMDVSLIGKIDVKDHYSLVAVALPEIDGILAALGSAKIKGQKIKIKVLTL